MKAELLAKNIFFVVIKKEKMDADQQIRFLTNNDFVN